MKPTLPGGWQPLLKGEMEKPYYVRLRAFVDEERRTHVIYPPQEEVFTAFCLTPFAQARVLILGQDPYHGPGQAHGLAFSVRPGVRPPPSLVNVFKELRDDLGCSVPNNGYLEPWARQGVMLLNAVLTVRAGEPNSHKGKGWETFTDAVIRLLAEREEPVVFVLWGGYAAKKAQLIDRTRHRIVQSAHPSPLSARRGFFGSRPFSQINRYLQSFGTDPIDWQIPDL
jgi:uracil-DNA glycosylase